MPVQPPRVPQGPASSPLMNAMAPGVQPANTRPMVSKAPNMFGGGRQAAAPMGPQRVSPGMYRMPNGQIVNSPTMPKTPMQRPGVQPMPRQFGPVAPPINQAGQVSAAVMPPNGMNSFNGASAQPAQLFQQPQTGGALQAAPGMQTQPWQNPGAAGQAQAAFPQGGMQSPPYVNQAQAGGMLQVDSMPGGQYGNGTVVHSPTDTGNRNIY